jgi:hypothetical protein
VNASVYIEPTVVSYLTARPTRDKIKSEKQRITREWWAKQRLLFDCYVSQPVLEEITCGEPAMAAKRLESVRNMPTLAVSDLAMRIAAEILRRGYLPPKAATDALHVGVAVANGMEFLLTWNCTHIANAQVEKMTMALCAEHGLAFPVICTPEQLMGV